MRSASYVVEVNFRQWTFQTWDDNTWPHYEPKQTIATTKSYARNWCLSVAPNLYIFKFSKNYGKGREMELQEWWHLTPYVGASGLILSISKEFASQLKASNISCYHSLVESELLWGTGNGPGIYMAYVKLTGPPSVDSMRFRRELNMC